MRARHILLLTALCLAGCAPQQRKLIAYSGTPRAASSLAMLKPQFAISIIAIDGDTSKRAFPLGEFRDTDTTIYLEPGRHRLALRYRTAVSFGLSTVNMDVALVAGHRYLVLASTQGSRWWGRRTWRPELEDMTDHPGLWCVDYPLRECEGHSFPQEKEAAVSPAPVLRGDISPPPESTLAKKADNVDMLNAAQRASTAIGCGSVQEINGATFEAQCQEYAVAIECGDNYVCRPTHVIKQ